jgi:hypothetical protein
MTKEERDRPRFEAAMAQKHAGIWLGKSITESGFTDYQNRDAQLLWEGWKMGKTDAFEMLIEAVQNPL